MLCEMHVPMFHKYVRMCPTGNKLHAGDHISWQSTIDGLPGCIENMLLTEDAKLPVLDTPLGTVHFVQVCLCHEGQPVEHFFLHAVTIISSVLVPDHLLHYGTVIFLSQQFHGIFHSLTKPWTVTTRDMNEFCTTIL